MKISFVKNQQKKIYLYICTYCIILRRNYSFDLDHFYNIEKKKKTKTIGPATKIETHILSQTPDHYFSLYIFYFISQTHFVHNNTHCTFVVCLSFEFHYQIYALRVNERMRSNTNLASKLFHAYLVFTSLRNDFFTRLETSNCAKFRSK